MYQKSDIRTGMFMFKDCGDAIVTQQVKRLPSLAEIAERLERVRKKLAIVEQVVGNRKRR